MFLRHARLPIGSCPLGCRLQSVHRWLHGRASLGLSLIVAGGLATACVEAPIPLAAAKGTTILFPFVLPLNTRVGFTSNLGRGIDHVDLQYGETLFILVDPNGPEYTLHPRWVSRAYPDPASPASIQNDLTNNVYSFLDSQTFALIDIPADPNTVPPGTYTWRIETRLPAGVADASGDGEGPLFRLYSSSFIQNLGTFEVLAVPSPAPTLGLSTPASSFVFNNPEPIEPTLRELIPFHTLTFQFNFGLGFGIFAQDLVIHYPAAKLAIETVFVTHNTGRASILRWSTAPNAADPTLGDLTIHFIDPDAGSYPKLDVAFDLISAPDPNDPIPNAQPSDFSVDMGQSHFYDRDGLELSNVSVQTAGLFR